MYRKFYFMLLLVFLVRCFNQEILNTSCLSLTLALQRSNESYKFIKHPLKRISILSSIGNLRFTMLLTYCLSVSNISLWLLCLLLRSGEIHPNPGPVSVTSIDSSTSSVDSIEDLSNHLSIISTSKAYYPKSILLNVKRMHMTYLSFQRAGIIQFFQILPVTNI